MSVSRLWVCRRHGGTAAYVGDRDPMACSLRKPGLLGCDFTLFQEVWSDRGELDLGPVRPDIETKDDGIMDGGSP